MVNWSQFPSLRTLVGCVAACGILMVAGCRTVNPVTVNASFVASPDFAENCPTVISVLPIEDGTEAGSAGRHLTFMRQEVNRQLVRMRGYSATTENWVDASMAGAAPSGESILAPASLTSLAQAGKDDAVLAVRVERWDETTLLADRRVRFEFRAAMVAKDGKQLWSGSMSGRVKAGGVGASPLGRNASARSCAELAVAELLMRLPVRIVQ